MKSKSWNDDPDSSLGWDGYTEAVSTRGLSGTMELEGRRRCLQLHVLLHVQVRCSVSLLRRRAILSP